ncbi:MAG TPA: alpha/beta hydrolase-fold protein [Ferruginibacter sp.]|nr:esterase [Bacteroidota bacterium]MBS1924867.1 esterase [Bacteroidota bacterium]HMT96364.1 alpha/beta hydrolase-fold protein [Ferruginibacter sp.]HMU24234.1 alpha/beta hydrolase-fold protein [Ferruginibacter sp.]
MTLLKSAKPALLVHQLLYPSLYLEREVIIDCYIPTGISSLNNISLLLINDGQDLPKMPFDKILGSLLQTKEIEPVFCVGIHCSADRKNEYGTARFLDYKGRGAKAHLYTAFIMLELLPFLRSEYQIDSFKDKSFAGFSLGGLCALDIVWNQHYEFRYAAVFSGSLWWRDKSHLDKDFDEDKNRIMQKQIRNGGYVPWLKFFFEVGTLDETEDRNSNGIIDSIDDTCAVIDELVNKGYNPKTDINYLEIKDGSHDVATWARAFPSFLKWIWGTGSVNA